MFAIGQDPRRGIPKERAAQEAPVPGRSERQHPEERENRVDGLARQEKRLPPTFTRTQALKLGLSKRELYRLVELVQ